MSGTTTEIKREILSQNVMRGSAADGWSMPGWDRGVSIVGGGLLAGYGAQRGDWVGAGLALLGGGLVLRGVSGYCPVCQAMHENGRKHSQVAAVAAGQGVKVDRSITIRCRADDLYYLWSNLDHLPRFFSHLAEVHSEGNRSHWVAKAPAGMRVAWEAEIVNQQPDRLIAWRSLEGSQVGTAGSVHFTPMGDGETTELRVLLRYDPPARKLGAWLAWLFGQDPAQQIDADLRRFKHWVETGQLAAAS